MPGKCFFDDIKVDQQILGKLENGPQKIGFSLSQCFGHALIHILYSNLLLQQLEVWTLGDVFYDPINFSGGKVVLPIKSGWSTIWKFSEKWE